jgi:hypothetical protein
MSDEGENSSAKSAIILAIIVVLVAAYCVEFGLQTLVWVETRHWASVNRWLLDVPQPLSPPTSEPKGTQLKAFNYEFLVPWRGNAKLTPSLAYVEFRFESGPVIVFFDPEAQLDTMRALKSSNPTDYRNIQEVLSGTSIDSNYALYQAIYSASPVQLSPFMPSRDAMRISILLLWKLSFGFDLESRISSFDFGKNRGFQFGDPANGGPVALRVFDDRNHQYRFIFIVAAGSSAKITQDDINSAIQSVRPVPILER